MEKKKRGRKPKNNIIVNNNPIFNNDNNDKIIRLHKNIDNENSISSYGLDCYDNVPENNKKSEVCWNCCHKFFDIVHGIPLKYRNNIFYSYGDFCSTPCMIRYAFDNYSNIQFKEIYSNICIYNNKVFNTGICPKIAPDKRCLSLFGGNMNIDEYRNLEKDSNIEIHQPNIIQLRDRIVLKNRKNYTSDSNLVLYRKTPINNSNNNIKDYITIKTPN